MGNLKAKISLHRNLSLEKEDLAFSTQEGQLLDISENSIILLSSTKPLLSKTNYYFTVDQISDNRIQITLKSFQLESEESSSFTPSTQTIERGQTYNWTRPSENADDSWEIKLLKISD